MMSSPNASSWLPWIWAVETLASDQANSSVLIDLVKKIPDDVLENHGKNAKELACLRILEGLSVSRKGNCGGDSSKLDGNAVGFGSSDCCENVLRQVLLKKSSKPNFELNESDMLRWDVKKFVQDKRSCLPICTLKQLKDVILKDSHLLPSSLKERSGLLINNCSDGVTNKLPEGSNCDAPENLKVGELSSVKRVVDDSSTADEGVASTCRQMIVYNAYPNVDAATKRKRDDFSDFSTQQEVEGNDSASFHESRHVEDVSGGIVRDSGREIISYDDTYHDENNDIIVREDALLTTQYSDSQDSFAEVNGTTQQLCMICKIGGQLLICSSGSCRRVVHERCLGAVPTFDANRRFYCPFCAYSRAVSEYSDSKKQYSLAKKALLCFISRDEYRLRNSNISGRADRNHLIEFEASVICTEQNNLENVVSSGSQARSMMHKKEKPSVLCDLSCRGEERVATCGENMVDKRNAKRSGRSVCFQSTREEVQQVPDLDVQNCKAYNSLHGGSKQLAVAEKLQEVLQQPNGAIRVRNNGEQKIASRAVQDSGVHYSNCKYLKFAHGSETHTGTNREQAVCNQPNVLPCELAKPLRSDVEGTSGEKYDKFIACYHSLRVQKQEQHYPYPSIPQLRRKKVPWSSAEEDALKEGVRRFASDHNRTMPWKKILEFGAEIFEKHRTAIDLKDKWRNICKGSPTV